MRRFVACEMAQVSLDDETLDVAVFGLSLMGSNVADYGREAHRTLKLDGTLHVIEATARFTDPAKFIGGLRALGFDVLGTEEVWKFTHIRAVKVERAPRPDAALHLS
jgi:ribosomal RNA-processing protein 8